MGGGISVHNLYKALDRYEPSLTIPVMGSSSGQTIAGVISTGTHGGVINKSPVADGVRAIRIVVPGGKECWIEPSTTPLTSVGSMERIARSIGIDSVYRDDLMFAAALTSVGCLGIITAVVMEVVPQFALAERKAPVAWSRIRTALINGEIFSVEGLERLGVDIPDTESYVRRLQRSGIAVPDDYATELIDLELFLNPYRQSNGDREAYIVARFSAPYDPTLSREKPPRPESNALENLYTLIAANTGGVDRVSERVTAIMHSTRFNTRRFHRSAYLRDTFYATYNSDEHLLGETSEICISTDGGRHIQLIDELLLEFQTFISRYPNNFYTGFLSFRFQKHSKALLSMQYGSDLAQGRAREGERNLSRTCHIEVQALLTLPATAELATSTLGEIFHPDPLLRRVRERERGNLHGANDYYLLLFENIARRYGARFHWGQLQLLNRRYVETSYSQTLYQWRKVRTLLAKDGDGRTFSNDFSERTGLESYSEVIAVCQTDSRHYDFFGYKEDGTIAYLRWDGEEWREPDAISNPFASPQQFTGPLTCSSAGNGHVRLFGTGIDNHLLMYERNGGEWTPTDLSAGRENMVFPFNSPISSCIWPGTSPKTFLFGFATSGHIICVHNNTEDDSWTIDRMNPDISGQRAYGHLQAVSIEPGRIDLFARDISGVILHQWKREDSDRWHYEDHILEGRSIATPIAVTSYGNSRMEIFGLNEFGHLIRLSNESFGSGSSPWRKSVYRPPSRFGSFRQHSTLAQSQETEALDSHYDYITVQRVNSFFGELCAVSSPEMNRIDVFGLGKGRGGGLLRSCYQTTFSSNRIEWKQNFTSFWS